jgi:hypothetical protein
MGRAHVTFKCVIDKNETATHGPICGKKKCERLFKCIPIEKQELITKLYKELRDEYKNKLIVKLVVKDEIETMQLYANKIINTQHKVSSDERSKMTKILFNIGADNENEMANSTLSPLSHAAAIEPPLAAIEPPLAAIEPLDHATIRPPLKKHCGALGIRRQASMKMI